MGWYELRILSKGRSTIESLEVEKSRMCVIDGRVRECGGSKL